MMVLRAWPLLRSSIVAMAMLACGGAWANTVDNDPFAARYPAYAANFSCGSCHTTAPALNPYGFAYKNSVEARGGRITANVSPALGDIEPLDSDGDTFSNIAEINAGSHAGNPALIPANAVVVAATPTTKAAAPGATASYIIKVTNNTGQPHNFTLSATVTSGAAWTPTISGTANNVPAGGFAEVTLNVAVSSGAMNAEQSVATVSATSMSVAAVNGATAVTTTVSPTGPRYVAVTGIDGSSCRNPAAPCRTITYALSVTPAGAGSSVNSSVNVGPGTYNVALGESFPLQIKNGVSLTSTAPYSEGVRNTIIDATGSGQRVLAFTGTAGAVSRLTIKGGTASGNPAEGGAVRIVGGNANFTLEHNIFIDNEARGADGATGGPARGGAVFIAVGCFSTLPCPNPVRANVFTGNTATGGNAAAGGGGAGGAAEGGAIYATSCICDISHNTFDDNLAIGGTGGSSAGSGGAGGSAFGGAIFAGGGANTTYRANIYFNNSAAGGSGGAGSVSGTAGSGNAGAFHLAPGANLQVKENYFSGNIRINPGTPDSMGTGDMVGTDPLFHDASQLNYRLRRTSPAANVSPSDLNTPTPSDHDGRPILRTPGAFERSELAGDRLDLNRDRKSDMLWRNEATGLVWRMTMNGFTVNHQAAAYQEPNTDWKIAGQADFNADGFSDILWRNSSTGEVWITFMGAGGLVSGGAHVNNVSNPAWKIIGTPDLDRDGKADILWYNTTFAIVWVYHMDGATIRSESRVYQETVNHDTNWQVEAVGEFGYTSRNSLVFRNIQTGVVWFMPLTTAFPSQYPGQVQYTPDVGTPIHVEPNLAWKIIGSADFDGDTRADLLWRNDQTGQVYIMLMDEGTIRSQGFVYVEPNLAWKIVATGDYNGDGKADLLWRNDQTGQVYMMLMNGLSIASQAMVYQEPNTAWKLMGPREYAQ